MPQERLPTALRYRVRPPSPGRWKAGRCRQSDSTGSTSPIPTAPSNRRKCPRESSPKFLEERRLRSSPSETSSSHPEFQRPSFPHFHVIAHLQLFKNFSADYRLAARKAGRNIRIGSDFPRHHHRFRLYRSVCQNEYDFAIRTILNRILRDHIKFRRFRSRLGFLCFLRVRLSTEKCYAGVHLRLNVLVRFQKFHFYLDRCLLPI